MVTSSANNLDCSKQVGGGFSDDEITRTGKGEGDSVWRSNEFMGSDAKEHVIFE